MGKERGSRRTETYDKELGDAVTSAQQGDEAAFSAAYRLVHPPLLGYLRGLVGDDAEDVASDAWLEIARDLGRFRGDGAGFRAWTASIARNRAIDHLRRIRSRPRGTLLESELAALPSRQDTAAEAFETVSTRQALDLIARLPRRQAEAVLLQTVIGLDGPAAARVLGTRPGAVRSATHRGLKRLERYLSSLTSGGVTDSNSPSLGDSR
ncbi:RNA polymerase sigma factor [Streptomyces peucetius]|uniref:RNA polymerase sigma factor n=1 Tax=Streptomyces peucetius TaxID=1950 RepID=UPI0039B0D83C